MRWILATVSAFFMITLGALDVDMSGRYENTFYPQMYDSRLKMTDINKFRLDLQGKIDERIDFQANYNIELYDGKTYFVASECIPEDVLKEYADSVGYPHDRIDNLYSYHYSNSYYLDNANLTLYWKDFDLRVGKQLIPWGTGYSRNPTDCFHYKNILDPTYDKRGINAFKLGWNLTMSTRIIAIMSVDDDWETSKRAVKFSSRLLDYDFSLSYVRLTQRFFGESVPSTQITDQLGADISGQLLGLGIWAEAAWRYPEDIDCYMQILAGTDYTLDNGLYLMAEYFYNERGEDTSDDYTFYDWVNLLDGSIESLGRNYAFTMAQYPITELMNGSLYVLYNASDGSAMLYPWVDFTLGDNIESDIVVYLPVGNHNSEYGASDIGGMLRLKVYF